MTPGQRRQTDVAFLRSVLGYLVACVMQSVPRLVQAMRRNPAALADRLMRRPAARQADANQSSDDNGHDPRFHILRFGTREPSGGIRTAL